MTIWLMCIACWIPKATDKYSEYVILIAFPLQQWLHEPSSILRYTYIVVLFCGSLRGMDFTRKFLPSSSCWLKFGHVDVQGTRRKWSVSDMTRL